MTGGWAAINTLREHERYMWSDDDTQAKRHSAKDFDAALALVEAALDAAARAFEGWEDPVSHNWQDALDALGPALRAVREGRVTIEDVAAKVREMVV